VGNAFAGVTTTRLCRALEALGFVGVHGRIRHGVYRHPDGRIITIPVFLRRIVPRDTLRAILTDAGISDDELRSTLP
jgi:predicted RNA binding protein YcfA (HicA-like mRNA interferase family)